MVPAIMHPVIVLLVVGLTPAHLGPHTPRLSALARAGAARPLTTVTPAVTCTVQATFMTGTLPREHGIVANGWLFRDLMEVWLWRQSNRLVDGEKIWEAGKRRDPAFTTANLFWWYNMGAAHDIGVTPRPIYKSDGRKLPDCYTQPVRTARRADARARRLSAVPVLGTRDVDRGVALDRRCRAACAAHARADADARLPAASRLRPAALRARMIRAIAKSLAEIDAVAGDLIADAERDGARVIVLSEYGISPVSTPIHVNRALREAGLLGVRVEDGGEMLDVPQSRAFAVADHQIAHIYVAEPDLIGEVKRIVAALPGVEHVLDRDAQRAFGLDHSHSGELVALAQPHAWFTYYYWLDDRRAPDFARMVEIHRKPGYDPVELFLDPAIRSPKLAIGWRLARRALGFRTLMDVIPLDAEPGERIARPRRRLTSRPARCSSRARRNCCPTGRSPRRR